jgi:hypothetical protein
MSSVIESAGRAGSPVIGAAGTGTGDGAAVDHESAAGQWRHEHNAAADAGPAGRIDMGSNSFRLEIGQLSTAATGASTT